MSNKSYLVVVHASDHSLHETWMNDLSAREFDLFVSYSGDADGRYASGCDRYEKRKAPKYPGLGAWLGELGKALDGYKAIWLPDDNLITDTAAINRMFRLFTEHKLQLAHPAFKQYAHNPVSAQHIDYVLRYTPFVFASAPIFSIEALRKCLPTFAKSATGSALGYIWPKLLQSPADKIAILDAAPVKRRPRVQLLHEDGYEGGSPYVHDAALLEEFGITAPRPEELAFQGGIPLWELAHTASNRSPYRRKRKMKSARKRRRLPLRKQRKSATNKKRPAAKKSGRRKVRFSTRRKSASPAAIRKKAQGK
ncbi:hypothetical protein ACFSL6_18145 [Paenibacillus thailandensis]|uniref:DUF707 domain-containing protein n=1 Tax=Paenibacillus thailandensis TaxID=393250 RepID=A0ABW5QRL4_9BACL